MARKMNGEEDVNTESCCLSLPLPTSTLLSNNNNNNNNNGNKTFFLPSLPPTPSPSPSPSSSSSSSSSWPPPPSPSATSSSWTLSPIAEGRESWSFNSLKNKERNKPVVSDTLEKLYPFLNNHKWRKKLNFMQCLKKFIIKCTTMSALITTIFLVILFLPLINSGCYYLLKHYENGDQVMTNEPCLNCTCINSMLMCYLRVCPFIKPLGEKCIIEKKDGQCCPSITCPDDTTEEPTTIPTTTTTTTTTTTPPSTASKTYNKNGCEMEGFHYEDGDMIPSDPNKPCEICYCIQNRSMCTLQECRLEGVTGCEPIYQKNTCCPVRYNCSSDQGKEMRYTTQRPQTSWFDSGKAAGCQHDGKFYEDGAQVPSKDKCEHCYCMRDEIVCAIQECRPPCDGCVPIWSDKDSCCPEKYECYPLFTTYKESNRTKTLTDEQVTPKPKQRLPALKIDYSLEEQLWSHPKDISITKILHGTKSNKKLVKLIPNGEKVTTKPARKRPKIKPGLVPGEGVCRYDKKIYQNGQKVNSSNPCMEYCMCINSVVYCDEITCQEDLDKKSNKNCREIRYENRCCPRYECRQYEIIEQQDISDIDVPRKTGIKQKPFKETWKPSETTTTETAPGEDMIKATTIRPDLVETKTTTSVIAGESLEPEIPIAGAGITSTMGPAPESSTRISSTIQPSVTESVTTATTKKAKEAETTFGPEIPLSGQGITLTSIPETTTKKVSEEDSTTVVASTRFKPEESETTTRLGMIEGMATTMQPQTEATGVQSTTLKPGQSTELGMETTESPSLGVETTTESGVSTKAAQTTTLSPLIEVHETIKPDSEIIHINMTRPEMNKTMPSEKELAKLATTVVPITITALVEDYASTTLQSEISTVKAANKTTTQSGITLAGIGWETTTVRPGVIMGGESSTTVKGEAATTGLPITDEKATVTAISETITSTIEPSSIGEGGVTSTVSAEESSTSSIPEAAMGGEPSTTVKGEAATSVRPIAGEGVTLTTQSEEKTTIVPETTTIGGETLTSTRKPMGGEEDKTTAATEISSETSATSRPEISIVEETVEPGSKTTTELPLSGQSVTTTIRPLVGETSTVTKIESASTVVEVSSTTVSLGDEGTTTPATTLESETSTGEETPTTTLATGISTTKTTILKPGTSVVDQETTTTLSELSTVPGQEISETTAAQPAAGEGIETSTMIAELSTTISQEEGRTTLKPGLPAAGKGIATSTIMPESSTTISEEKGSTTSAQPGKGTETFTSAAETSTPSATEIPVAGEELVTSTIMPEQSTTVTKGKESVTTVRLDEGIETSTMAAEFSTPSVTETTTSKGTLKPGMPVAGEELATSTITPEQSTTLQPEITKEKGSTTTVRPDEGIETSTTTAEFSTPSVTEIPVAGESLATSTISPEQSTTITKGKESVTTIRPDEGIETSTVIVETSTPSVTEIPVAGEELVPSTISPEQSTTITKGKESTQPGLAGADEDATSTILPDYGEKITTTLESIISPETEIPREKPDSSTTTTTSQPEVGDKKTTVTRKPSEEGLTSTISSEMVAVGDTFSTTVDEGLETTAEPGSTTVPGGGKETEPETTTGPSVPGEGVSSTISSQTTLQSGVPGEGLTSTIQPEMPLGEEEIVENKTVTEIPAEVKTTVEPGLSTTETKATTVFDGLISTVKGLISTTLSPLIEVHETIKPVSEIQHINRTKPEMNKTIPLEKELAQMPTTELPTTITPLVETLKPEIWTIGETLSTTVRPAIIMDGQTSSTGESMETSKMLPEFGTTLISETSSTISSIAGEETTTAKIETTATATPESTKIQTLKPEISADGETSSSEVEEVAKTTPVPTEQSKSSTIWPEASTATTGSFTTTETMIGGETATTTLKPELETTVEPIVEASTIVPESSTTIQPEVISGDERGTTAKPAVTLSEEELATTISGQTSTIRPETTLVHEVPTTVQPGIPIAGEGITSTVTSETSVIGEQKESTSELSSVESSTITPDIGQTKLQPIGTEITEQTTVTILSKDVGTETTTMASRFTTSKGMKTTTLQPDTETTGAETLLTSTQETTTKTGDEGFTTLKPEPTVVTSTKSEPEQSEMDTTLATTEIMATTLKTGVEVEMETTVESEASTTESPAMKTTVEPGLSTTETKATTVFDGLISTVKGLISTTLSPLIEVHETIKPVSEIEHINRTRPEMNKTIPLEKELAQLPTTPMAGETSTAGETGYTTAEPEAESPISFSSTVGTTGGEFSSTVKEEMETTKAEGITSTPRPETTTEFGEEGLKTTVGSGLPVVGGGVETTTKTLQPETGTTMGLEEGSTTLKLAKESTTSRQPETSTTVGLGETTTIESIIEPEVETTPGMPAIISADQATISTAAPTAEEETEASSTPAVSIGGMTTTVVPILEPETETRPSQEMTTTMEPGRSSTTFQSETTIGGERESTTSGPGLPIVEEGVNMTITPEVGTISALETTVTEGGTTSRPSIGEVVETSSLVPEDGIISTTLRPDTGVFEGTEIAESSTTAEPDISTVDRGIEASTEIPTSTISGEERGTTFKPGDGVETSTVVPTSTISGEERGTTFKPGDGVETSTVVPTSTSTTSEEEGGTTSKTELPLAGEGIEMSTKIPTSTTIEEEGSTTFKPGEGAEGSTVATETTTGKEERGTTSKPGEGFEMSTMIPTSTISEKEGSTTFKPGEGVEMSTMIPTSTISEEEERSTTSKPGEGVEMSTMIPTSTISEKEGSTTFKPGEGIEASTLVATSTISEEEERGTTSKPGEGVVMSTMIPTSTISEEEERSTKSKPGEGIEASTLVATSTISEEEERGTTSRPGEDIEASTLVTKTTISKEERGTTSKPGEGFETSTMISTSTISEEEERSTASKPDEGIEASTMVTISTVSEEEEHGTTSKPGEGVETWTLVTETTVSKEGSGTTSKPGEDVETTTSITETTVSKEELGTTPKPGEGFETSTLVTETTVSKEELGTTSKPREGVEGSTVVSTSAISEKEGGTTSKPVEGVELSTMIPTSTISEDEGGTTSKPGLPLAGEGVATSTIIPERSTTSTVQLGTGSTLKSETIIDEEMLSTTTTSGIPIIDDGLSILPTEKTTTTEKGTSGPSTIMPTITEEKTKSTLIVEGTTPSSLLETTTRSDVPLAGEGAPPSTTIQPESISTVGGLEKVTTTREESSTTTSMPVTSIVSVEKGSTTISPEVSSTVVEPGKGTTFQPAEESITSTVRPEESASQTATTIEEAGAGLSTTQSAKEETKTTVFDGLISTVKGLISTTLSPLIEVHETIKPISEIEHINRTRPEMNKTIPLEKELAQLPTTGSPSTTTMSLEGEFSKTLKPEISTASQTIKLVDEGVTTTVLPEIIVSGELEKGIETTARPEVPGHVTSTVESGTSTESSSEAGETTTSLTTETTLAKGSQTTAVPGVASTETSTIWPMSTEITGSTTLAIQPESSTVTEREQESKSTPLPGMIVTAVAEGEETSTMILETSTTVSGKELASTPASEIATSTSRPGETQKTEESQTTFEPGEPEQAITSTHKPESIGGQTETTEEETRSTPVSGIISAEKGIQSTTTITAETDLGTTMETSVAIAETSTIIPVSTSAGTGVSDEETKTTPVSGVATTEKSTTGEGVESTTKTTVEEGLETTVEPGQRSTIKPETTTEEKTASEITTTTTETGSTLVSILPIVGEGVEISTIVPESSTASHVEITTVSGGETSTFGPETTSRPGEDGRQTSTMIPESTITGQVPTTIEPGVSFTAQTTVEPESVTLRPASTSGPISEEGVVTTTIRPEGERFETTIRPVTGDEGAIITLQPEITTTGDQVTQSTRKSSLPAAQEEGFTSTVSAEKGSTTSKPEITIMGETTTSEPGIPVAGQGITSETTTVATVGPESKPAEQEGITSTQPSATSTLIEQESSVTTVEAIEESTLTTGASTQQKTETTTAPTKSEAEITSTVQTEIRETFTPGSTVVSTSTISDEEDGGKVTVSSTIPPESSTIMESETPIVGQTTVSQDREAKTTLKPDRNATTTTTIKQVETTTPEPLGTKETVETTVKQQGEEQGTVSTVISTEEETIGTTSTPVGIPMVGTNISTMSTIMTVKDFVTAATTPALWIEEHSTIAPIMEPTNKTVAKMNKTMPLEKELIHSSTVSPEEKVSTVESIPLFNATTMTTKINQTTARPAVTEEGEEVETSELEGVPVPETSSEGSVTESEEEVWTDAPGEIVTVPTIIEPVSVSVNKTKPHRPLWPLPSQQEEEQEPIVQEQEPDEPITMMPGTKTKPKPHPHQAVKKPTHRPSSPTFTDLSDGSCVYDGKIFQSAEQIPRPHPCDFCFCFRGDIICLQQTCPPPVKNCVETHIDGFCCPRYECPVHASSINTTVFHNKRMARDTLTSRSTTNTISKSNIHPPPYSISIVEKKGCRVDGVFYEVGHRIDQSSNPCLDCRCDPFGLMTCNPLDCSSSLAPLMLRMNRNYFIDRKGQTP